MTKLTLHILVQTMMATTMTILLLLNKMAAALLSQMTHPLVIALQHMATSSVDVSPKEIPLSATTPQDIDIDPNTFWVSSLETPDEEEHLRMRLCLL